MARLRNPLTSLLLTILAAAGLAALVAVPVLVFPWVGLKVFELQVFYLGFASFMAGMLAGRASFIGSMGLVGALLGGFVGILVFQFIIWPTGLEYFLALGMGGLSGLGGLVTGKLGVRRVQRAIQELPELRRCQRCGSRVGLSALRCWSCKAYLPPI